MIELLEDVERGLLEPAIGDQPLAIVEVLDAGKGAAGRAERGPDSGT